MTTKNHKTQIVVAVTVLVFTALATGCHKSSDNKEKDTKVITAHTEQVSQKFHYKGHLEPLNVNTVASPVEGILTEKRFDYGQKINKGERLGTVCSDSLAKTYREALSDYLKQKNDLKQKRNKYQSDRELQQSGMISDEEYHNDRSEYHSALLKYYNDEARLMELAKKLDLDPSNVKQLELSEPEGISSHLQQIKGCVPIYAEQDGVALFPENKGKDKEDIHHGSKLEKGQAIVALGQNNDLKVKLELSEYNINQMKKGQKATITGPALDQSLHGELDDIAYQASSSDDAVATFPAKVVVKNADRQLQHNLRVGLSTKVTISKDKGKKLLVPINAVHQKGAQPKVTKVETNGTKHEVGVSTGAVYGDKVVIVKGLKEGDQLVTKVEPDSKYPVRIS